MGTQPLDIMNVTVAQLRTRRGSSQHRAMASIPTFASTYFTTGSLLDVVPPSVVDVNPPEGEAGVPRNVAVSVLFAASLGVIQVGALGVLGLDEFSMLVLLAGEFTPPLQLSFGFTLVGVGGLVGLNRRVDDNQIAAAASSGDLSHLLFPRDPVAEAPRLLDALSRCFPYEDGATVIGQGTKIDISAHSMRRGFAARALQAGVSQVSLESMAGWAPGSTMVSRYTRMVSQEVAESEYRSKMAG
jgi:hypothetical protein